MDEKELEALHKALSQQFDIGDYDTFKSKMQTPDDRKNFYNAVGEKGFDLGDFDEYEKRLGGVKKKVGSINFEKSSLQSGNDLSQSQSPSPLPSEESGSINPILGEITQIKDLESRTKDIPMPSSGKGGNIVVKAPDDVSIGEAKKKKEQFKELYGIDADEFSSEIEGLPEIAYTQKGFTPEELIQIKKDNPQNYQRRIATAKVQVGLRDKINQQFADGNIDEETRQYLINSSKSNTNNYNVGDYNQQRGIVKGQAALIDQVGGEDAEKLKSALATERSKVYGDAYKNGFDNIVKDSEESKYLSNNALLGYQYIKDLSPEKAKQYERLFIDAKSLKDKPNEQKGYNHLMQTLEETGVNLQLNAINEDLNSLNKEAKNNGGGLSPEQLSKAEQLEKKYNELTTYNNELDSKYPDRVDNKVDDALQEVLGQRANFGGYLAGKLFTSVAHTAEGVWEAVSSPFMSDASNNMRELAIMGENLKEQYTFHKTDKNKSINDSQLLIQPELQSQIDIVKNNKSLSDEQKEKQVTSLLKNNLDKFGRVPIKGGKFDVSPSSILYGVTDIAATLVPFIALESVTGGGASAGAARKFISTFTAAAATSFHDEYAAAIMDGKPQSEAYKYAMASTAISSFAMAGAGTAEAIKKMAGMETSAGKIINKMTDSEISAMMSKTPKALRGIAERVKATPKMFAEGAKAGAKFEGFMAAGNELKNQVLGTPIDREQNFKQSLIGVLNFGILGAGLGHIGYKSPTELQKSSFLETGKNPTEFIEQARQMVKEGNLSSTDFEQVKNNIESSAAAYKNLPTTNSKGQPLSEKDKGDYLYNEAVKNEALKKQLPPRQKEKAENTALVADFKNDYILEPKTDKQLESVKSKLEKSLEPKKDAEGKTIEPNEKEVKEAKAELEAINDIIENKPKEEDTRQSEKIEGIDQATGIPEGDNVPPPTDIKGKDVVVVDKRSDADIEKRMLDIEDGKGGDMAEFNKLEKEMEKRERATVFDVPLDKVNDAVDALMKKEKEQPNGYGSFIEKRDARETKEVADKYSNPKDISDAELKQDFRDAVLGNPDTWYADGLKLRESMKEATERGIDIQDMIGVIEKEYKKDGYTAQEARETVARKLKPIFEGSQKVETDKSRQIEQSISTKSDIKNEVKAEVPENTIQAESEGTVNSKVGEVEQPAKEGGQKPPVEPPKGNNELMEEDGGGKKDFDKMTANIPSSGEVKNYLSGETILENQPNTELRNPQGYIELKLNEALKHGVETVEKAKEIFGKDYVEKTLEYIDQNNIPIENKALLYVSLENEMAKRILAEPDNAGLKKIEDLVRIKSQAFLRSNSKAINMGRLRAFAKTGFDTTKITDSFFSSKELEQKKSIEKSLEADADTIQKQYEENKKNENNADADIEAKIKEGVDAEIAKLYEALPKEKKTAVDKAISALDKIHEKLRGKAYESTLGIPLAIIDMGVVTIRAALKAGVKAVKAIEMGIDKIKEKYGKEWANENEFRKDYLDGLKSEGILDAQQRRQAEKEYRMLETERNRQLARVTDLREKLNTLQKGERPTTNPNEAKPDTPEIEALKQKVKEETKKLNVLDAQQRRIDVLETELERLQSRIPKEKSESVKREISDKEQKLKDRIEEEKATIRKENKENNQLRLIEAKDVVRQRIEKIKTEIANKERELKEKNKPLNEDLELKRLREIEKQITELRDKYLPEEKDIYEIEKQREKFKDKLVSDIIILNEQINIGERNKKSDKPNYENDAEISTLKKIREDKKAILNEIDPLAAPKEKTIAERRANAESNLQKSIDAIREEILSGEREVKESKSVLQSKKLEQLREQKKALEALRDKYLPKGKDLYSDKKAAKAVEDKLVKENIELNRQILKGEKDIVENKISPESKNIDNLKAERDARREILEALDPTPKIFVENALIKKGFGKKIKVKTKNGVEEREVLDWKKLAGEERSFDKIQKNVEDVLKESGYSDEQMSRIVKKFKDEYNDLTASIIEKSMNELAKRNKESVSPEQKGAAKKLAELYNYGLFEKDTAEYDKLINTAIGSSISPQGFEQAKKIANAMQTLYSSSFKGVKLNDVSSKAAMQQLENNLRLLLSKEAKMQGNNNLKIANIVKTYMDIGQTMILNNLKQAVENPFSGLQQNVMEVISGKLSKDGIGDKSMSAQRSKMARTVYKDMLVNDGVGYGDVQNQFSNRGKLDDYVNKLSDNQVYQGVISTLTGKATLDSMDAMFKSSITEKKFATNLIKILTNETNPNRMPKGEAIKFVSEKLTGQTFKDAQQTAKEIIEKINKDAGEELVANNPTSIDRVANDIVKSALEMGDKITTEQINAAYKAAYKAAGEGLGHEANNFLSSMVGSYTSSIESKIQEAVKEKDWNRAAYLTYQSTVFRNMINPFVGGGTNWLVLKLEKTGLGIFTGLGYQLASKKRSRIDLSSESGAKNLEKALYNQARFKDKYMRGVIGGGASLLTYLAFLGIANTDDYRKWRDKNKWSKRYLDTFTPEFLLAQMAAKDDKLKQYFTNVMNKNDAFDASTTTLKAIDYASKGETGKMWGAFGDVAGTKFNFPLPWRLVKDGQVLYQGVTGQDPYNANYKPSIGFANGVFKGGVIEWLGFRPK